MKLVEPVFEPKPTKHEVNSLGTRLYICNEEYLTTDFI